MNVVLVVLDTLRRDHLGCYGNPWIQTPNLDHLSALGTTFEHCYLSSSPCMPARHELMTGRYEWPWRGWGPLEPGEQELYSLVGQHDHLSMLVTDHYHLFERGAGNYHCGATGWQFIRGQENDAWVTDPDIEVVWPAPEFEKCHFRWRRYFRNTHRWRRSDGQWRSLDDAFCAQVFRAAANWVDRHADEDGWLLHIDCFDPHEPFDPPAPFDTLYAPDPPAERVRWPIYGEADRYTEAELADIRALYAGKVSLVDRWFGHLLARLQRHGLLDRTLLIVTTDHGYVFGQHSMIGKPGTSHGDSNLYQAMAHLPLWVVHPDVPGGRRHDALVQMVDYLPTILDAWSIEPEAELHGGSLLPLLTHPDAAHRAVACASKFGEGVMVTDGRYTLFQWPPGEANTPLYWYGSQPPQFLKPRGVGELEPAAMRYPIDHVRGPNRSTLYDTHVDPGQERDLLATQPAVAEGLRRQLAGWLERVGAPAEVAERLGLAGARES